MSEPDDPDRIACKLCFDEIELDDGEIPEEWGTRGAGEYVTFWVCPDCQDDGEDGDGEET